MSSNTFKVYSYPYTFVNENWGTVNTPATESVDLGLVSASIADQESYGLVTEQIELEYNGVITVSGGSDPAYEDYGFIVDEASYEDYESIISLFTPYEDLGFLEIPDSFVESVAYSYNIDSVEFFEGYFDPYGALDALVTYEDNGSIVVTSGVTYEDYGLIFWNNQTIYPYGTILVTDAATGDKEINVYVGSGEISFVGIASAVEKSTKVEEDKTLLGTFSGVVVDSFQKGSFNGSGTFSTFGSKVESRSYSYNEDSIYIIDTAEDYGSISTSVTSSEDYGSSLGAGLTAYGDYGVLLPVEFPYGTILISGAANDATELPKQYTGSGEIVISGIASAVEKKTSVDAKTVLGTFSGVGAESFQKGVYTGSGSIGIFSGLSESRTYYYSLGANISTFDPEEDYGSIGISTTLEEDYQSIASIPDQLESDYEYVINTTGLVAYGGGITLSGSAINELNIEFIHIGSGEIVISGIASAVEKITKVEEDKTLLGTFSGVGNDSRVKSYVGSGSVGIFSGLSESRTYNYNIDSIDIFEGYFDPYGALDALVTYEDWGLITSLVGYEGYDDYGFIFNNNQTTYPYGTINISGSALNKEIDVYDGSGEIVISGIASAVEKITKVEEDKTLLGTFSGVGSDSRVKTYIGSGSVGIFSGLSESVTYDYNIDSINTFAGIEDYGTIDASPTEPTEDYGTIDASPTEPTEDYELIIFSGDAAPYGTIIISGSSVDDIDVEFIHIGSGEITISGIASAVEKKTSVDAKTVLGTFSGVGNDSRVKSYVGLGTFDITGGSEGPYEDLGFITDSVSYEDLGLVTDFSTYYLDYGFVVRFEFVESVTYSYNIDSIDVFEGYFDPYGALPESVTYEDLGLITTSLVYEDYGFIVNLDQTTYPYGTIVITDVLIEQDVNSYVGSGSINVSRDVAGVATAIYSRSRVLDGVGLGTFSGAGAESFQKAVYTGSGSVGIFSGLSESRTYDYNEDSIYILDTAEDYGSVGVGATTFDDYGSSLGAGLTAYNDYGVLLTGNLTPYGTIVISGATDLDEQTRVFSHLGSGSIGIFSGTAEVVGWNPPDKTVDILISGQAQTAVEAEYTPDPGIGTIYVDGSLIERRTYSYNINATSLTYESEDNGLISNTPDVTEIEGGSIASIPTDIGIDYGLISIDQTRLPYGTIVISGAVTNQKAIFTYDGSGTIGIFSGTADSFGVNPPDQTVDVVISGDAATRYEAEYTEVGIGTVNVSGFATDERRTFAHLGSGQIDIGGDADAISNVPSPTSGTIDVFGRARESFNPATHVGIGTGFIGGEKLESRTYIYNETSINPYIIEDNGSIADPATYEDRGILSDIVIYEDYGFVFDDKTRIPYDGYIQISGTSVDDIDDVYTYNGSGTIGIGASADPVFYTPEYPGIGTITVSGSALESKTPATYIGVGTGEFSIITGSAEVVGWNPPDQTVDIVISGVGSERFTTLQTYSGIGTISIGGTASPVFYTPEYPGSGTIVVSGSADPVHYVPNYPGIGTIFAITGAAEAFGAKPPVVPADIIITGVGSEAYAPGTYSGIGTIFVNGVGIAVSNPYREPFVFVTII